MNKQAAQITITTFGYSQKSGFTAAVVLTGH